VVPKRSCFILLIVVAVVVMAPRAGAWAVPSAPPDEAASGSSTGVIEGVVRVRAAPQRRATARYPGGDPGADRIQDVPAVVYLKGPLPGSSGAGTHTMAQRDKLFEPPLLVVQTGAVVEFPNHDPFFHNVFSYSRAARFDLGRYPQGESKEVRFEEAGEVKVYCEVHESMRAAIVVVENPYWAQPDEEGRFRIEGVPAGTHTLVGWHVDRGDLEVEVTVTAGGTARVELTL
jgi:plastocyanin